MYHLTIEDVQRNRFGYPERIRKAFITQLQRYGRVGSRGVLESRKQQGKCTRADIEHLLLDGPQTSQELADRLRMSKRCVLAHLARLQTQRRVVRFLPEDDRRAWFRLARGS